mgnify:CR=1 FL=1
MSINRDMKEYTLQQNEQVRTPSGAEKASWADKGTIRVAVYKKNDLKVSASEKYIESTHTGLTYCKDIDSDGYRLVRDGVVYEITDCNTEGRLTNLLLKVVR